MSQFEQLERYKKLLDDNIITEEEFRKIKQKILGLKEGENEAEQKEEAAEPVERKAVEDQQNLSVAEMYKVYQNIYDEEKAKERARMEIRAEFEQKERYAEQQQYIKTAKTTMDFVVEIILWPISLLFLLMAFGGLRSLKWPDICVGVLSLFLAIMACPLITKKTRHMEELKGYYKYKKVIVVLVVISLLVAFSFVGKN